MKTYQLRPVTVSDAIALHRDCWPNWSIETVEELLRRAEDIAARARGLGIVAIKDDQMVGYGQLTLWPRGAEISDLLVAAPHRNNGIGSAMVQYLVEVARSYHLTSVEIGAALGNPRALALYRRLGFRDERIITLDLGNGPEPIMYLTMDLTPNR